MNLKLPYMGGINKFRSKYPLLLLIIASFVVRLFLINQDISIILNKFLVDDTYYYFAIAKNIVNGHGIVFNYGIPTNGFHPLYVLILVPIFILLYPLGVNLPIYASLFIATIFSIGTSIFLFLIASKLLNREAGLLAAFFWLFNPYILFVSFMAMETPIQIFFISMLTYFLMTKESEAQFSTRDSVITGILIGIIFLSRMDGVFVGIGVIGALTIRKLFKNKEFKIANLKRLPSCIQSDLVIMVIAASLTVLPWIAWNLIELNRITPISGEALRMIRLSSSSYPDLVISSVILTKKYVARAICPINIVQVDLVAFLALIVPITMLMIKRDSLISKLIFSLDFLIISSVIYYAFYWFYQLGIRPWYSLYTSFLVTIIFSTVIIRAIQRIELKFKINVYIILLFILVSAFIFGGIIHYKEGNYPAEELKWEISDHLNKNIPLNETIGSFNTGIYQYYTMNHDVINLDGVVNPEALQAKKDGSIEVYILEKNITYIADPSSYIEKLNSSILSLEPIETFEMTYYYRGRQYIVKYNLFKVSPVENTEAR